LDISKAVVGRDDAGPLVGRMSIVGELVVGPEEVGEVVVGFEVGLPVVTMSSSTPSCVSPVVDNT